MILQSVGTGTKQPQTTANPVLGGLKGWPAAKHVTMELSVSTSIMHMHWHNSRLLIVVLHSSSFNTRSLATTGLEGRPTYSSESALQDTLLLSSYHKHWLHADATNKDVNKQCVANLEQSNERHNHQRLAPGVVSCCMKRMQRA
jgi:hypothetical protein